MATGRSKKEVIVVGSGPAGLMAADVIASGGHIVTIIEKRRSPGRKILIAGSSGLNVSNSLPLAEFKKHYSGAVDCWSAGLDRFPPAAWLEFIQLLGHETFLGTSGRYFLRDLKSGPFVRSWRRRLDKLGVRWLYGAECIGIEPSDHGRWQVSTSSHSSDHPQKTECLTADAVVFALGGASYEPEEVPLRWPVIFRQKQVHLDEFRPSNVGFNVTWPSALLAECEGEPLKNISIATRKGSRRGELVITRYGIEGTPVYMVGEVGTARIDLKPDMSVEQILGRCRSAKENLAPIRRVGKLLNLCRASHALLYHTAPSAARNNMETLVSYLKNLPLELTGTQPLPEAISSAGGIALTEISDNFMLKKLPGVFAAGEMLSWDAPTGGFLIQACVSQGFVAGHGVLERLA